MGEESRLFATCGRWFGTQRDDSPPGFMYLSQNELTRDLEKFPLISILFHRGLLNATDDAHWTLVDTDQRWDYVSMLCAVVPYLERKKLHPTCSFSQ